MNDIQIRPYDHTDKDFIYASWLHNYKHSSKFAQRIRNDLYYFWHEKLITAILSRTNTHVSIACLPEDPEVILGYIVTEQYNVLGELRPVIHFCLVKEKWRKMGIAKGLVSFSGVTGDHDTYFTHWTNPMDSIVNRKDIRLVYDPYKI